jgi:hypothetical protein
MQKKLIHQQQLIPLPSNFVKKTNFRCIYKF